MRLPNFDRIAFAYDTLKHLVFGHSLRQAQIFLIPYIPEHANILIIGGGTGQIVLDILEKKEIRQITYVELSEKMLNSAKDKAKSCPNINFVLGSGHQLDNDQKYDVILTPFILDLYSDQELGKFLLALDKLLLPSGVWLLSDFKVTPTLCWKRFWQLALVKLMYLFFFLTSNSKVFQLPDYDTAFKVLGYKTVIHRTFYGDLVHSQILSKKQEQTHKP